MENNDDNVSLLEMPVLAGLIAATPVVQRAAGEALFEPGEPCNSLPLVVSGNALIYTADKAGRQVTLYRLKPGSICPISLSALLQYSTYPATASAETTVQVRYLPGEKLTAAISGTPEIFSAFLDAFAACLYDSVCTVHQQVLDKPDVRPEHLLSEQFSNGPDQAISSTQQNIVNELGATRAARRTPIE